MDTMDRPAMLPDPMSFVNADLEAAARLGAAAKGAEVTLLQIPIEIGHEFPEVVPVGLLRGDNPQFKDVSQLLEPYRLQPRRRTGTAKAQTLGSFIDLVARHKSDSSALFANADWRKPSLTAVLDYHYLDHVPNFGQHRVHYAFPLSEEWKVWVEQNGSPMNQTEFAAFLEDNIADLASPMDAEKAQLERDFATKVATPAEVVQLSRGLAINAETRAKTATTLQTGEGQLVWEEVHNDANGNKLIVPGIFMLAIAPFFMGEKVRIPVRLRYRLREGKLSWFYQLYRPDIHVTEHVRQAINDAARNTGLPAYEGEPEMPAAATNSASR